MLPGDDPALTLDRERLEQVLERRVALAGDLPAGEPSPAGVDARILGLLGGEPLGELLDIGTGTGRMLRLLGRSAATAVGIDISRRMLMLARSNLHAAGLATRPVLGTAGGAGLLLRGGGHAWLSAAGSWCCRISDQRIAASVGGP